MKHEFIQNALQLSRTLPDIDDNERLEDIIGNMLTRMREEEGDCLSFNEPCYCNGSFQSGKYDSHSYFKLVSAVGDVIVMRILMLSHHYELLDSFKYAVVGNMTDEEREELERLEDIDDNNCSYAERTEVAQIWFFPNGEVVKLARPNVSGDYSPHVNWCNLYDNSSEEEAVALYKENGGTKLLSYSGLSQNSLDYAGGWIANYPFEPCESNALFGCMEFGWNKDHLYSNLSDPVEDNRTTLIMPEAFSAMALTLFRNFIRQYDNEDDFAELYRMDDPCAVTLKHWGYNELWAMFIAQGMASAAAKYYHSIKIAHRNGFDASTPERQRRWMALLNDITFCNGNIQDPRNFMPANFEEVEAMWKKRRENRIRNIEIARKKAQKEAEELKRLNNIERTKREDVDYQICRGEMLRLVMGNENIAIHVLQNVTEFYDEGIAQEFCVYDQSYFKFPHCITMSARCRKTGKRLSTITYDLVREEIFSNLTKGNNVPEQFDEIEDIIEHFKPLIHKHWVKQLSSPYMPEFNEFWLERQEGERRWNLSMRSEENKQKAAILARRRARAEKCSLAIA